MLTDTQKKIYAFILKYQKKHGVVPSTIVSARHFNVSRQAMQQHYARIVQSGLLRKVEQKICIFELGDN